MKNLKSLISLFLAVILAASCCSTAFAAGDHFDDAEEISFGNTYSSSISESDDTDFYFFSLSTSGRVTITTTGFLRYINLSVYDKDGNELSYDYPEWNSTMEKISDSLTLDLVSGKYYIKYSGRYSSYGKYSVNVTFMSASESFKESLTKKYNIFDKANVIEFDKTYKGQIATNDSKDFYKMTLSSSGTVDIKYKSYMYRTKFNIYDKDGNSIFSNLPYADSNSGYALEDMRFYLTSGTYYIGFIMCDGCTGNYNFSVKFKTSGESFKESDYGTNNTLQTAEKVSLDKNYKGQIALNDEKDFYKFTLSSNETIVYKINTEEMGEIAVCFFDKDGEQISYEYMRCNDNTGKIKFENEIALNKGTYYFGVFKRAGYSGDYAFTLYKKSTLTVGTPKSLKATPSTKSIKLTWNKVSGAEGYVVYKYTPSNGKYTKLGTTTSASYTVKDLKPGKDYSYAVKAYKKLEGKTIYSKYSVAIATATKPSTVSIKVTGGKKQAKISWSKIDCTKYVVYMATSKDGTYSKIATTSATSVTKKDLKAGKTYYFKVRAYKSAGSSNIYGAYSSVKSAKITK